MLRQITQDFPLFKRVAYVIWAFVAIVGLIILGYYYMVLNSDRKEFIPYSARVTSFYTEKVKRGGVFYQKIKLNNNTTITANGFTTNIQGQKIRLIDYIAVGDSIVCDSTDKILHIHRIGTETYIFTQNPNDFRN